jgi:type IV secretion system protein VirB10
MQINVPDRIPEVRSVMDARLKYILWGAGALAAVVLVWGYHSKTTQAQQQAAEILRKPDSVAQPAPSNAEEVHEETLRKQSPNGLMPMIPPQPVTPAMVGSGTSINGMPVTAPLAAPGTLSSGAQPPVYAPINVPLPEDPVAREQSDYQARLLKMRHDASLASLNANNSNGAAPVSAAGGNLGDIQGQINQLDQMGKDLLARPRTVGTAFPPSGSMGMNEDFDPNGQRNKQKFQQSDDNSDYQVAMRVAPVSQWVLERGDKIPATLTTRIVSDLPGDMVAEVSKDVLDSPTHTQILIPHGSLLVGSYNSLVSYGQGRVQEIWEYLRFPDGSYMNLDKFQGHAADGTAGVKDQTDNHIKRLIGGVLLSSIFAAGIQLSQNRTQASTLQYPSTTSVVGAAVGEQAGQLGQQITQRNLNVQPTLKVRPGEIFYVDVKKAIVFSGPYEKLEWGRNAQ